MRLLVALVVLFAAFASTTSGGVTSSYGYDGDGRRLSSTMGGGGADLRFVWDALAASGMPELALERDSSGSLVRRYLGGPTGALNYTTSGGTFWYHHDPLNTVTDVTDAGGGAQWRYEYEAYGAQRSATNVSGSAPENRLRFNGQQLDLETGLLHLRARQYDPGTGRFGALDPVENPLLDPYASAYGYVNGRPTLFVDPEGLFLKQLGEVLAGGADTVSFGASTRVLEAGGVDINTDSNYFQAGQVGGSFVGPGGVGAYVARRAATQGLGRGARTLRGGAVGSGTAMSDCLIRGAVNGHGCTAEQAALDGLAGALGGTLLGPLAQRCIPRKAPTGPTAAKEGGALRNLGRRLADERGSVGGGADDVGPRLIYEHNPKHGRVTRQGPRGEISRAPRGDCQSMLECSTLVKPGLRKGVEPETGLEVIFRRHRVFENTESWHGYVPGG